MPQIQRQTPHGKPATVTSNGKSVLDRIAPVKPSADGLKFSIYGRSKTGKTRFACTFPKPLLLIGFEDGTKSVRDVDFVRVYDSSEMQELTQMLATAGSKYKTVVVDTATAMRDLVITEILGMKQVPVQKSWQMATRDQWGACAVQVKERLRALLDISERTKLNTVIIAQEQDYSKDDDGSTKASSDMILPSVGSALGAKLADWLNTAVDYVCNTYIREEMKATTHSVGGKSVNTLRATGKKDWCLRVGPDPVYMTGFRLPPGSAPLPDLIVDPSFDKVARLIKGER